MDIAHQPAGVDSAEAAREVIGFYLNRWKIEDYFRILKSGCRVEYLAFRTADRLSCAIAINAVIAWRIQLMTLLGREAPHNDPRLMFTDEEITFLRDYARAYGQPLRKISARPCIWWQCSADTRPANMIRSPVRRSCGAARSACPPRQSPTRSRQSSMHGTHCSVRKMAKGQP